MKINSYSKNTYMDRNALSIIHSRKENKMPDELNTSFNFES